MTNLDAVFKLRLSSHKATLLVSTIERSTRVEAQVCHMQEPVGRNCASVGQPGVGSAIRLWTCRRIMRRSLVRLSRPPP